MNPREHGEPTALPEHARELLARYVDVHTMSPDAMERVALGLRRARSRRATAAAVLIACAVAAACLLAWGLAAAWRPTALAGAVPAHDQASDRRAHHDAPASAAATIAPAELPVVTAASTAASASPTTSSPTPTKRPRPRAAVSGSVDAAPPDDVPAAIGPGDLAAERALLSRAWQALADDDIAGALALVETHRRDFAAGALVPERDALAAIGRCRRSPAAGKAIAAEFAHGHASAALRTRVREACEFVR